MSPEEFRTNAANLQPSELLNHVRGRGWLLVDHGSDTFWLLEHPEHDLRQLLLLRDADDAQYGDAVLDVIARLADVEQTSEHAILLDLMRPTRPCTERDALEAAVAAAQHSTCAKSQRGVVVFSRSHGVLSHGWNAPPAPFRCDGSQTCRANCNKLAVHAEMAALHALRHDGTRGRGHLEMLHVKIKGGVPVASGPPSCLTCSREVLASGIRWFWLLHEGGLRRYSTEDFHAVTLRNSGLPVIR